MALLSGYLSPSDCRLMPLASFPPVPLHTHNSAFPSGKKPLFLGSSWGCPATSSLCPLPITEAAVAGSGIGAPWSGLVTNLALEGAQGPFSGPISMDAGGATVEGDRRRVLSWLSVETCSRLLYGSQFGEQKVYNSVMPGL